MTYKLDTQIDLFELPVLEANLKIADNSILGNLTLPSDYWSNQTFTTLQTLDSTWKASGTSKVNIHSQGIDMTNECDIRIGDFSLKDSLARIEKQLGILNINEKLESEWAELKELGEKYRELEKNIKDKIHVWDILKK
jgi:hypothetical protein